MNSCARTSERIRRALECLLAMGGLLATIGTLAADDAIGLPREMSVPASRAPSGAIALGRKLFFDTRLSADGTVSCASCHQPEHAFTDTRVVARGIKGRLGTRNTPTLINAAFESAQFWDGRRK